LHGLIIFKKNQYVYMFSHILLLHFIDKYMIKYFI
jgi:hypothetical protein